MDFKDNIPDLKNKIKDDVPDMKGNNEELKDSVIVDDNLDDDNPSNGYYFRTKSGWQICWYQIESGDTTEGDYTFDWTFPVTFDSSEYKTFSTANTLNDTDAGRISVATERYNNRGADDIEVYANLDVDLQGGSYGIDVLAIGRWDN